MIVSRASVVSLFALALPLVAACSGAGNQDLFGIDPAQGNQSETAATNPGPSDTSAPTPSPSTPTPTPTPDPNAKDGSVDAPTPPKCAAEVEPNDDRAHATVFTSSVCGKVSGASDVDFLRFVVPTTANKLTLTHEEKGGKLAYRYWLEGGLLSNGSDDPPTQAIPGATYTVQVKLAGGGGGDHPTYQVNVSFQ